MDLKVPKVFVVDAVLDDQSWMGRAGCPYLPAVDRRLTAEWTRIHRGRRDAGFYRAALEYGQSLWMEGKPAQAILQLNKAWSADLEGGECVLSEWPLPYRALVWMLKHAPEGRFLGNPVRHFLHLATRVRGERAEIRIWRAWACSGNFRWRHHYGFDQERPQSERCQLFLAADTDWRDNRSSRIYRCAPA